MFLMIDNYDSFVYNLVRYYEELGINIKVCRNDKITINEIEQMKLQGIIISPGPKSPKDAGISLEIIDAFKGKIPILGICLGHQTIGHYFGCDIVKGKEPVHGKISEVYHNGMGVFTGLKSPVKVTRYHSLVVENMSDDIEVTAQTKDGVVMGIRHKEFLIEGVQFHPEAELTEHGHKMLKNFLDEAEKWWKASNK